MSDLGFRASRRSAQVCTAVLRVARSGPSRAYRTSRALASSPYCRHHACRRQGWAVSAAILADGMPSSVRNLHGEPYWRSSWRSLSVWPGRPQRPATARYCKISEKPVQLPSRSQILLATRSARRVPEQAYHSLTGSALTWAQSERETAAGSAETAA
jgi:hypothetical protein